MQRMLGVIMTAIGTFFEEVSTVIGKKKLTSHEESPYTFGFLSLVWGLGLYIILVLIGQVPFVFQAAALPTFVARVFFEILQVYGTILAIEKTDRTTFSFVRAGTIPLLLITDIVLGYALRTTQIVGMGIILAALLFIFLSHTIRKNNIGWVVFTTVNAVATVSLFKYNITHFNSVAGEAIPMLTILLVFLFWMAHAVGKENPVKMLRKGIFFEQSAAMGVASVLEGFAFLFAPASIIISAKRSLSILWSTLSGHHYFHEEHYMVKLMLVGALVIGLVFLAI